MALIYYSSCKYTAFSPEYSNKIQKYLKDNFGMTIHGCCRPNHSSLTPDDTAICICNTCSAICRESSKADKIISLWEFLNQDNNFPFPDYHGSKITIQDCWRCNDRSSQHEAVRSLLRKMNFEFLELSNNRTNTKFCGTSTLAPPVASNCKLAPKRFIEFANGLFIPHTEEEQIDKMKLHCQKIETDLVACYCVPCTKGIRLGGKKSVHLLNLLFDCID